MSGTVVLVIDMLNDYEHPDADLLIPNVESIIDPLSLLLKRAHDTDDADVVYVNDNYGDFTADHRDLVNAALAGRRPDLVGPIVPARILYTALDAYVRHFDLVLPPDALAHIVAELGTAALKMMEQNMAATLLPAAECISPE